MDKANYSDLYDKFSPGDLLLFRGSDWVSKTILNIEMYENGKADFSHVGVVVNAELLPFIPQLKPHRWYILESTCTVPYITDGVPDIRTGMIRFGVQIRDLEHVIRDYEKTRQKVKLGIINSGPRMVAWSRLKDNPWSNPDQRPQLIKDLHKLIDKIGYRPYEYRLINLLAAAFPWLRRGRTVFDEVMADAYHALSTLGLADNRTAKEVEESTLFCSQLVCMFYQCIGCIDDKFDPSDIDPMDYLAPRDPEFKVIVDKPIEIIPDPEPSA